MQSPMEIYKNKTTWKLILAIIGMVIVLVSMLYSQYLAKNLSEKEDRYMKLYAEAQATVINSDEMDEIILEMEILSNVRDIPIITESEKGELQGFNYGDDGEIITDQEFLKKKTTALLKTGFEPFKASGYASKIYYEKSKLYKHIRFFPLAQILLLSTFLFFAYYLFSTSRKAEQNRVWAGMAKETAHQLGTPISAILGWIEHLKEENLSPVEQKEIVSELRNDVTRLELIADRFSKIGSKPDLKKINLVEELNDCKLYMQRRAPKRVHFDFPDSDHIPVHANINSHLFDWVIENILRNALDAMSGQGTISVKVSTDDNKAIIDLSDTGKGIDSNKFKSVFDPGYTTKKRGWGLGLSLAKRIIENYHSGKIFVKNSIPNEKTTFSIQLPLA